MLEEKGRQMLMKDNLIDLNFTSEEDQKNQFLNNLHNDFWGYQNSEILERKF